ncbi:hypothetical protein N9134_00710 [Akkermansiaceae bacterium]|nr:hypothetical protein [bacterium]MDB4387839.1 hypothetical protein [Akkermansiaceae bacterium]MDB4406707.1 hypothetical protein [Akkermansiaceae bacterium]MDB4433929.1 hypothetical protein [Akkermansiaceae bacterium]MDB4467115.1 hypothetical protein [Akkermansiaceae bacterium]
MKFKAFIFGLLLSFGLPWLLAIVVPYSSMRNLDPVRYEGAEIDGADGLYLPKRSGRIKEGSEIYGAEGCYYCHTQLVRPTYAGSDLWRPDWGGLKKSADNLVDTRRETLATDYQFEKIAHIGVMRVGHDLSNLGRRLDFHLKGNVLTPEDWLYLHLYNPRDTVPYRVGSQDIKENSTCPSKGGLFKEVSKNIAGADALHVDAPAGQAIVPTDRARALVSYLISLKKDTMNQPIPKSLNSNPSQPVAQ